MKRIVFILLATTTAVCQEATITWIHQQAPVYPQMARIAHIFGSVALVIEIQPDGAVVIKNAVGHPILVQAARDSFQHSTLRCDGCGQEPHTFVVVYKFKIEDPPPPLPPSPTPTPAKAPRKTRDRKSVV